MPYLSALRRVHNPPPPRLASSRTPQRTPPATMPINHISLNATSLPTLSAFYAAALRPLGYAHTLTLADGQVHAFSDSACGGGNADFWLAGPLAPSADGSDVRHGGQPDEKQPPPPDRAPTGPLHIAFSARSRRAVREFYHAAMYRPPPTPFGDSADGRTEPPAANATARPASDPTTSDTTTAPSSSIPTAATSRPSASRPASGPKTGACSAGASSSRSPVLALPDSRGGAGLSSMIWGGGVGGISTFFFFLSVAGDGIGTVAVCSRTEFGFPMQ